MPKANPANPKPVIHPTPSVLVGMSALLLLAGVMLLVFGQARQADVAAFVCLALLVAIVTFGLLGAKGVVKTRDWQLSGSAAVFLVVLGSLLPFVRPGGGQLPEGHELKGTLRLDELREGTASGFDLEACRQARGASTLFLFDFLHDQISEGELQAFHNFQSDRLDRGIRNHLRSHGLLEELEFQVKRCSDVTIRNALVAQQAAAELGVPAVMWGYISKGGSNELKTVMTLTVLDRHGITIHTPETLGEDVTELIRRSMPIPDAPLAVATFLVGETYLSQGRTDLAQRAFLHVTELIPRDADDRDDYPDLINAIQSRLDQLSAVNPAAALRPLGG